MSTGTVKTPSFLASAALAVIIALQGWVLTEVSSLRVQVAVLNVQVKQLTDGTQKQIAKIP